MVRAIATACVLLAVAGVARAEQDYVWWEGERPTATNFPGRTWLSGSRLAKREGLSEGDWLTSADPRKGPELFARYRIDVPRDGVYQFWTRKFWKHGPFRWRFEEGGWRTCGRDIALADTFVLQTNVSANWVHLGEVTLTKGSHDFELRLLAREGENATAAFDAFLLIAGPFSPRGRLKPGERTGKAEPGWWAFEPPPDPFAEAALDLRSLNEPVAGQSGFVGRKGLQFTLGDGTPVRFWGVNAGPGIVRLDRGSVDYLAKRLAKVGVNIVRYHGPIFDQGAADPTTIDAGLLDDLHYFVAALKKQGIYVHLSFYFPLWFDVKPSYGIPGYDTIENKRPFALLFFDPRMQAIYKAWARALLTTKNPHTGVPLAKEPAVATVEVVNEDSYLFWTFAAQNVPRVQMRKLETEFGAWLTKRYGSIEGALAAWGRGAGQRDDAPAEGRAALLDIWNLTSRGHGEGPKRKRMTDQLRFLTEHQRAFYEGIAAFLRNDLGARSLVSCSNWHTADPVLHDALERYTYTAGDVIDRHGYFGGRHQGPRASYSVSVGDTYTDRAAVLEPEAPPITINQMVGHPHTITEIGWPNPNRFKAECPFLCAAYGSLQGMDGYFFFALNGADWTASVPKFAASVPTVMGQFPATALMYRRGDVAEAETVAHEALALEDLYDFKGSAVLEAQNLDALRQADVAHPPSGVVVPPPRAGAPPWRGGAVSAIDPLAFYVGRVTRSVEGDPSTAVLRDLSPFIDRTRKTIRSVTGEVAWDYGQGIVTVNTPRSQGAAGFLGKVGRIDLNDVVIESQNEFGTILVTSLDGKPLAESGKVLVEAMTEEKPYGWTVTNGRITDLGGQPLLVRNIDATVTLKGRKEFTAVRVLNEHGYDRGKGSPDPTPAGVRLRLAPDAMYTICE